MGPTIEQRATRLAHAILKGRIDLAVLADRMGWNDEGETPEGVTMVLEGVIRDDNAGPNRREAACQR